MPCPAPPPRAARTARLERAARTARLERAARTARLALVLTVGACTAPTVTPPAATTGTDSASFDQLPGWQSEHVAQALPVMLRGCARLALTPPDQRLGSTEQAVGRGNQAGDWLAVCAAARRVPPADEAAARAFLTTKFTLVALTDASRPAGLFTGYYEPEIDGSREQNRGFAVPVRTRPADLVETVDEAGQRHFGRLQDGAMVPYYSRAEIDHGALRRQRLDLLYLSSQIDLFFLQVQGSGRVILPNGRVVRIGYAGTNGQPYVPIGRVLREAGELTGDTVSAASIRSWLLSHPRQAPSIMEANPAYTFFREVPDLSPDLGPLGTLGVQLTPLRSIAVDTSHVPLGAPVWIDTRGADGSAVQGLTFAQDTGSGVAGSVRADIFQGWGAEAEDRAGQMQSAGRAWLLLPRPPPASLISAR